MDSWDVDKPSEIPHTSQVIIQDVLPIKRHHRDASELALKSGSPCQSLQYFWDQKGGFDHMTSGACLKQIVCSLPQRAFLSFHRK